MGEITSANNKWRKGGTTLTLEQWRAHEAEAPKPPSRGTPIDAGAERITAPVNWRDQARCRIEKMPTSYFFPAEGDAMARVRIPAYCRRCQVRDECGEWATREGIPWGWWGGLSPQQRTNRVFDPRDATWQAREHGFQRYRFGSHGKNPQNGCRCDVCTEAARERWAAETARGAKRTGATR